MSISLGQNIAALRTQRFLERARQEQSTSFERLSSGQRINRASDDAAGLAVASSLTADKRVFTQGVRNLNDGISFLNIAEGALTSVNNILIRQNELAIQAANGVYSETQRTALDKEANALVEEFNRIIATTKFNGQQIFDNSRGSLRLQDGFGIEGGIGMALGSDLDRNVGDGSFQNTILTTGVGNFSIQMFVGDFNGDNQSDVFLGNSGTSVSQVLLGNNDGTFSVAGTYTTGSATGVAGGDFNQDGFLDVVTGQNLTTNVQVLLGNGNGTFKVRNAYTTDNDPDSVITGDVNGDGNLDIVTAQTLLGTVGVLLGNGDGSFKARSAYSVGPTTLTVSLGDVNGDERLDIISANYASNTVSILMNAGNGTFGNRSSMTLIGRPYSVATADFNGDGRLDLVASEANFESVEIYIGNGNGSFKAAQNISTGSGSVPTKVIATDINGDGRSDFVVEDRETSGFLQTFIGNGDGTFLAPKVSASTSPGQGSTLAADFNNDQRTDFISVSGLGDVGVLLGNGNTSFSMPYMNMRTRLGALDALTVITAAQQRVSAELGAIGATQSRLESSANVRSASIANIAAAASRITDVDIAQESSNNVRADILTKTAASVLAQANQLPSLALLLLR